MVKSKFNQKNGNSNKKIRYKMKGNFRDKMRSKTEGRKMFLLSRRVSL